MCGIVGSVHAEPGHVDQPLVRQMCALIRRRGPDDDGFYFGESRGIGHATAVDHRCACREAADPQ